MAEINNTQWLEEYLKMWTPKERMGRIHKVTTFDPTYHCYPEGVYLLDDDCRAHTAIYVVDKNHNVHIIYDGMAWDLLARAVEKGLLEISLKLSEGDKGLVAVLERMLAAQNTCCAGLQAKLKKIGDELERIADAVEGGAKPKPKPDPDPEPKPEKKTLLLAEPDRHEVTEDKKVYTSVITSIVKDVPEQPWTITDDFADYPDWATVSTDKSHVYITTDGSKPGKGTNDPWHPGGDDPEDGRELDVRYNSLNSLSDITPGGYTVTRYTYEHPDVDDQDKSQLRIPSDQPLVFSMNGESKWTGPSNASDWLNDIPFSATNIGWDYTAPMKTRTRTGREYEIQPLLHIYSYSTLHTDGTRREIKDHPPRDLKLPLHFGSAKEIYPEGFPMTDGVVNLQINYWSKPQAERILRGEQPKNVFLALFSREIPSDATYKGAIELSFTSPSGSKETQTVSLQDAMDDPTADNASFCIPASPYRGDPNRELHDFSETKDISFRITEPLSFSSAGVDTPLVAKVFKRQSTMLQGMDAHLEDLPASFATGDDLMDAYWYTSSYIAIATADDMKKIEEGTYFTDHEFTL